MSVHRPPGPPQHPQTKTTKESEVLLSLSLSTKIDICIYIYIHIILKIQNIYFLRLSESIHVPYDVSKMKGSVPCIFREKGSATVRTVLWYYTCKKKLQKESWIDKLMNQFSGSEVSNKKKVPLPSAFKIFPQKFPTASNLHGRTKKPRAPRSGCLDLRPFETSLGVQWPRQSAVALPPHPHGSAVRWLLKGSSEGRWVVEVSASEGDFVSCKMSLQNGGFFLGGGGGVGTDSNTGDTVCIYFWITYS